MPRATKLLLLSLCPRVRSSYHVLCHEPCRMLLAVLLTGASSFSPCGHRARAPAAVRAPVALMQGGMFKGLSDAVGKAVGGAAGGAIEAIQQAASEAAGQEENPWAAERAEKTVLDPSTARPLPDSFDDAVGLVVQATGEALADGSDRLVLEFDTSAGDETYNLLSRTLKLVEPFLPRFESEVLLPPLPKKDEDDAEV
eukprot:801880-Prymnesium_polylepis.1